MLAACAAVIFVWSGTPASTAERARGERRAEATAAEAWQPSRQRPAARAQRGRASYYSPNLVGRRMADGGRFDPRSDAAAHRTLPLGSKARVRNLGNGRAATVTVRDRGPHAPGRIVDVSPGTAERLGMTREGVAPVEVAPVGAPRTGGGAEPESAASGGGPGRARR
jgi:rare lipoprotein A